MTPELAATTCDVFLSPAGGFEPEARVNIAGMRQVLGLRSEYGQPRKSLSDPLKYLDLTHCEAAAALR
jgi:hypothetical protein